MCVTQYQGLLQTSRCDTSGGDRQTQLSWDFADPPSTRWGVAPPWGFRGALSLMRRTQAKKQNWSSISIQGCRGQICSCRASLFSFFIFVVRSTRAPGCSVFRVVSLQKNYWRSCTRLATAIIQQTVLLAPYSTSGTLIRKQKKWHEDPHEQNLCVQKSLKIKNSFSSSPRTNAASSQDLSRC
jgi:hypothetical protein